MKSSFRTGQIWGIKREKKWACNSFKSFTVYVIACLPALLRLVCPLGPFPRKLDNFILGINISKRINELIFS